ncbi:MAG: hypothetical protein A3F90_10345 [Deltaproteobacteria bacterium RIFCSPLOWO2_12_FULL_60_19]|nr:MAG: hypothetical protein A3F90_10345 [Deltaproteobacteria bacterium RIFCSPLOWO2_12_FULL_60_19]
MRDVKTLRREIFWLLLRFQRFFEERAEPLRRLSNRFIPPRSSSTVSLLFNTNRVRKRTET